MIGNWIIEWAEGEGLFQDEGLAKELSTAHKIFCRRVGVDRKSRQTVHFLKPPFLVDKLSLAYIYQHKICKIDGTNET